MALLRSIIVLTIVQLLVTNAPGVASTVPCHFVKQQPVGTFLCSQSRPPESESGCRKMPVSAKYRISSESSTNQNQNPDQNQDQDQNQNQASLTSEQQLRHCTLESEELVNGSSLLINYDFYDTPIVHVYYLPQMLTYDLHVIIEQSDIRGISQKANLPVSSVQIGYAGKQHNASYTFLGRLDFVLALRPGKQETVKKQLLDILIHYEPMKIQVSKNYSFYPYKRAVVDLRNAKVYDLQATSVTLKWELTEYQNAEVLNSSNTTVILHNTTATLEQHVVAGKLQATVRDLKPFTQYNCSIATLYKGSEIWRFLRFDFTTQQAAPAENPSMLTGAFEWKGGMAGGTRAEELQIWIFNASHSNGPLTQLNFTLASWQSSSSPSTVTVYAYRNNSYLLVIPDQQEHYSVALTAATEAGFNKAAKTTEIPRKLVLQGFSSARVLLHQGNVTISFPPSIVQSNWLLTSSLVTLTLLYCPDALLCANPVPCVLRDLSLRESSQVQWPLHACETPVAVARHGETVNDHVALALSVQSGGADARYSYSYSTGLIRMRCAYAQNASSQVYSGWPQAEENRIRVHFAAPCDPNKWNAFVSEAHLEACKGGQPCHLGKCVVTAAGYGYDCAVDGLEAATEYSVSLNTRLHAGETVRAYSRVVITLSPPIYKSVAFYSAVLAVGVFGVLVYCAASAYRRCRKHSEQGEKLNRTRPHGDALELSKVDKYDVTAVPDRTLEDTDNSGNLLVPFIQRLDDYAAADDSQSAAAASAQSKLG